MARPFHVPVATEAWHGEEQNLENAKRAKKDEFYTQMDDIAQELKHYRELFKGKSVLCNCDDPYESNFFKYFALNFNALGLKKLVATCYDGSPISGNELPLIFDVSGDEPRRIAYKVEITEVTDANGDGAINLADVAYLLQNDKNVLTRLKGNGDFRSDECVELLKEADIVCTNPPFSLFREYVALLMKYGKKFLIIGNKNALKYKEVFPFVIQNKLWIGVTPMSHETYFDVPQRYIDEALANKKDRTVVKRDSKYMARSSAIWFTNLDHKKRHDILDLWKHYTPKEYPFYDNYPAIDVKATSDIPCDYDGVMGVPITFMDKYNPNQFEILGVLNHGCDSKYDLAKPTLNGQDLYTRIVIRRRK